MRVYNGCPDSELQAKLDYEANLYNRLLKINPEACATYFPIENRWHVHIWGNPVSGMHIGRVDAIQEAISILEAQ